MQFIYSEHPDGDPSVLIAERLTPPGAPPVKIKFCKTSYKRQNNHDNTKRQYFITLATTGLGVPSNCLETFFEAVDTHMQRLEEDVR
jgi:hypothetical protein